MLPGAWCGEQNKRSGGGGGLQMCGRDECCAQKPSESCHATLPYIYWINSANHMYLEYSEPAEM